MLGGTEQPVVVDATDEEIEAIVSEFGGDYRQAIRAPPRPDTACPGFQGGGFEGLCPGPPYAVSNRRAVVKSDKSQPVAVRTMTIANMRGLGIRSLDLEYTCGKQSIVDGSDMDGAVEVPAMKGRLRCSSCGRPP
jgi:hypothetical protein